MRSGDWQLLDCRPAWADNWTWDAFVAFAWQDDHGETLLVAVNYAPHQSQCYIRLPLTNLAGNRWRLSDRIGSAIYERDGDDLMSRGLYVDMSPWQASVFALEQRPAPAVS